MWKDESSSRNKVVVVISSKLVLKTWKFRNFPTNILELEQRKRRRSGRKAEEEAVGVETERRRRRVAFLVLFLLFLLFWYRDDIMREGTRLVRYSGRSSYGVKEKKKKC
ncbi:hypothetical protein NEUTE2DRAFT_134787 [Neurospora tetrasperma FGSC 2509]|nr:hypothetical protein NEUTE2DRAFT_134787 [Neurospora tetrasperma FGSC 2509]